MPWKDKTVEKLRKEFIEASEKSDNFSALCREFGITRATGYKWIKRFEESGELSDRSHAPNLVPTKTDKLIEEAILQLRAEYPFWGAKRIRQLLENLGYTNIPCTKTVNNILSRNGCISEAESLKRKAFVRFQRENCNELWQADFKGDFALGDGTRCYPLDIIDDCSRYCLRIEAKANTLGVRQSFEATFREFGLPQAILSDNGPQFAGFKGGYTRFERWLMDLDVLPIHGRIYHPQTQGKIERFHRSMKNELLNHTKFKNLAEADNALENWRIRYNEFRPHDALGMKCPAEIYTPSKRYYPDNIKPYEYSGLYRMIKVNNWGYLRFDNVRLFLSESMIDTYLEIRVTNDARFEVYYRNFIIAEIDAETGKLINRKIRRA